MTTAKAIARAMTEQLGGTLPVSPAAAAARLGVQMVEHHGEPPPRRAHKPGGVPVVVYDARASQGEVDAELGAQLAKHVVAVCRGDVEDQRLIAEVARGLFGVRVPVAHAVVVIGIELRFD
jgi:hypothetical protein